MSSHCEPMFVITLSTHILTLKHFRSPSCSITDPYAKLTFDLRFWGILEIQYKPFITRAYFNLKILGSFTFLR